MMQFKSVLCSALVIGLASGNVMAADVEAGVVTDAPVSQASHEISGNVLSIAISNAEIAKYMAKNSKGANKPNSGQVGVEAGATGITYFEVYAVGSSYVGWEYPPSYQTSTTYDHGGSVLNIAVLQYGYGNPNPATMNGISKSPASTSVLCGSFSNLHYCSVGETVTGWLYVYDYSGQQSGTFSVSANSTASPYGYWSDSIYVK